MKNLIFFFKLSVLNSYKFQSHIFFTLPKNINI